MQEKLHQEVLQHHNEPVLVVFRVGRIVGYSEDTDDCYMIVKFPNDGRIVWVSMCGGYTYLDTLKGANKAGDWDDFIRLDNMLELNGVPKEEFSLIIEWDQLVTY